VVFRAHDPRNGTGDLGGRGQSPNGPEGTTAIAIETEGANTSAIYAPEGEAEPNAPNIGFIDSPTAACYQPDASEDVCYINWYYMSVSQALTPFTCRRR
jgi:hypothetical protein